MKSNKQNRAVHRPITINIENVEDLPVIRSLPQETLITVNLKMNRVVALMLVEHIQKQLNAPEEIDLIASTITGTS